MQTKITAVWGRNRFLCITCIYFIFHILFVTAVIVRYRIWHTWLVNAARYFSLFPHRWMYQWNYKNHRLCTVSASKLLGVSKNGISLFQMKMPHHLQPVTISSVCAQHFPVCVSQMCVIRYCVNISHLGSVQQCSLQIALTYLFMDFNIYLLKK